MVAMLGLMRTEWMPASLRALSAWDPVALSALDFSSSGFKIAHTRVIELSGLSNGETTRANDEHLLHIDEVLGTSNGTALKVCLRIGSGLGLVGTLPRRPGEASDVVGSSLGLPLLPDASRGLRAKSAAGNARSCLASLVEQLLLQLAGQLAAKSHGCVLLSVVVIGLWCGQSGS